MNEQGQGDKRQESNASVPHPCAFFPAQGWVGVTLILLAAAIATAPLLWNGFSCGHDFDFHLVSWMDALNAWRHGVFYPEWTASANYNAGEPRFVFYPPLTWMLGAVFGALFGWQGAPIALTFVLLAATGLSARALAKELLPESAATLAGCIAIFCGYALYCVYERAAYGELAGGCTLPLVLLFALKRQPNRQRNLKPPAAAKHPFSRTLYPVPCTLLLSIAIAASWLANAPVGVMACYLLAAFSAGLAATRRSWYPILRATAGVVLGLGLAAFYIVPAAVEQKWVDIRQATEDPGLAIENSFLFARHANPEFINHDIELHKTSLIATVMLALAIAAILGCLLRKRASGKRSTWLPLPLVLIPFAILFLQFPISLPVWNLLPKLRFLQFPWRWLVALEAPLGIFAAAAIWPHRRWARIAVATASAAAFLYVAAFAGTRYHQQCDDEDAIPAEVAAYDAHAGFVGTDEYTPPRADNSLVATNLPAGCLVTDPYATLAESSEDNAQPEWSADHHTCDATYPFAVTALTHRRIQAAAPHAGYLILRLRQYPAWQIGVNGNAVAEIPYRSDGLYAVPVPEGKFTVTADWTTTWDVIVGRVISFAALLAMGILVFLHRRRAQ